jgi:hypothetical protein
MGKILLAVAFVFLSISQAMATIIIESVEAPLSFIENGGVLNLSGSAHSKDYTEKGYSRGESVSFKAQNVEVGTEVDSAEKGKGIIKISAHLRPTRESKNILLNRISFDVNTNTHSHPTPRYKYKIVLSNYNKEEGKIDIELTSVQLQQRRR